MKKTMIIIMISLMAIWSCQKEKGIAIKLNPAAKNAKTGDSLISLSGIIWKIDYVPLLHVRDSFIGDLGFDFRFAQQYNRP